MDLCQIQEMVRRRSDVWKLNNDVKIRVIDLASEVGELSKEVLEGSQYGDKDFEVTDNWQSELGDVLFSLISIANETGAELQTCLQTVIDKYENRMQYSNNIGSTIDE